MSGEIITCPKCGYHINGPDQWGCYCEIEPGGKPDECVLDTGELKNCVYAMKLYRENKTQKNCEYWRKSAKEKDI